MTKYYVELPEEGKEAISRLVQEKAFEDGYEWGNGSKEVDLVKRKYLEFFPRNQKAMYSPALRDIDADSKPFPWQDAVTKGVPAPSVDYSKWVGLPVWVWDNLEGFKSLRTFHSYNYHYKQFHTENSTGKMGCRWDNCERVTKEELQDWMDKLQNAQ